MYWITVILYAGIVTATCPTKEDEARQYLEHLDKVVCQRIYNKERARFNYATNNTEENLQKLDEETGKPDLDPSEYKSFDWKSFNNSYLLRQAKYYGLLKKQVDPKVIEKYSSIINTMVDVGTAPVTICSYKNQSRCGADGAKDFNTAFDESLDLEEIIFYSTQFINARSQRVRPYFEQYVNISFEYAEANGYANRADMMIDDFEDPPVTEFECAMRDLWDKFLPLYEQYLSYNRRRHRMLFGEKFISKTGPIPHVLMSLERKQLLPYPEARAVSVEDLFAKKKYTPMDNARMSEDFYTSLGLEPLPQSFWEKSMFEEPNDREVDCIPTTYSIDKDEFRISLCYNSPYSLLHEMGHCHYYHALRQQPCSFRQPPNDGLDESVADSMTIAIGSNKFLSRIGVLNSSTIGNHIEEEMNSLYLRFKVHIDMIPETLLTELWRWNLLRKNILKDKYNQAFWDYRYKYGGTVATQKRSEEYIDAVGNVNLLYDDSLISYYLQPFIEYQIFEAACIAAGQFDPNNSTGNLLSDCDIYGSKEAGKVLTKLYKPGRSQPWTLTMKEALGKSTVDPSSFMLYYKRLIDFFAEENKKNGEFIGWK